MTRTRIVFVIAAIFAFALTVHEGNSVLLNATRASNESTVARDNVQNVHLRCCVSVCHWGLYRAGNGKIYTGCHRNDWSCAWASPCSPKACRWWWRRAGA